MLHERLKELRKSNGLTQEELAEILNVRKQTICGYERGIREPTIGKLIAIADSFNVSCDYLLGRKSSISVMQAENVQLKQQVIELKDKLQKIEKVVVGGESG